MGKYEFPNSRVVRSVRGSEDAHPGPAENRVHPENDRRSVDEPTLGHAVNKGPSDPLHTRWVLKEDKEQWEDVKEDTDQCLGHSAC